MSDVTNQVIDLLSQIQRLMKLKGENPFKIRAFEKAAHALAGREDLFHRASNGTLTELEGVGKGISEVISEYLLHGRTPVRDDLIRSLPSGLLELTEIPGLGPKKAFVLIEEFGIHSLEDLEFACLQDRLLKAKGFGPKLQKKILEGISFRKTNQGYLKLPQALLAAEEFLQFLHQAFVQAESLDTSCRIVETGVLRRRLEILDKLEFLVELKDGRKTQDQADLALTQFKKSHPGGLPIFLHFSSPERFGYELARTTGTSLHWKILGKASGNTMESPHEDCETEEKFFSQMGLPWIPPEIRETGEEVSLAQKGLLNTLLPWDGVRGIFHNHTTRSDGTASLEQMVSEAVKLGFEYIGISDHSQSAYYAQGLKEEALLEQEREVREVQKRYPEIRIFWGIESDILADGSLDYEEKILSRFDFVIASVHSRLDMDRDTMTKRILAAIRNPFTRFIGHPTGRLLLERKGYDIDMPMLIAEAAQHQVAIELNANPARLDLDWRWGAEMRKAKTLTSINPDAHALSGLSDIRHGISMARKALLPKSQVVNSRTTQDVEKWLKRR